MQKIKLYSSTDYIGEQEIFDEMKNEIEKLLVENNIEYALEITDEEAGNSSSKFPKTLYTLNLVIKQTDLNKVISILNDSYKYDYELIRDIEVEEQEEQQEQEEPKESVENKRTIKEKFQSMNFIGKCLIGFATVIYLFLIIFEIALIAEAGTQKGIIIAMLIETFIYLKAVGTILNREE